jgi:hypothetical protein
MSIDDEGQGQSWLDKPDDYKPGTMGCHEALHMVSFFAAALDVEVCRHPAIIQNVEWLKAAEKAQNAMAELYQLIGSKHLS